MDYSGLDVKGGIGIVFHPQTKAIYEPGSKLLVLGMVLQPLIGNPYNGYINPYYWVDYHPLLCGNNVSLDPSTYIPGFFSDVYWPIG